MTELTPANIGFLTAFFAANPIASLVFGMVFLAVILAALSKYFKFGERNAGLDQATDAHIKRLNDDIAKLDKRLEVMEVSLRDRDHRIAELGGTILFLTQKLESTVKDYERMRVENIQLQAVNTEQRGEIHRLELSGGELKRQLDALNKQVRKLEESDMHRRASTPLNRRKTDQQPVKTETTINVVAKKFDPRDSE